MRLSAAFAMRAICIPVAFRERPFGGAIAAETVALFRETECGQNRPSEDVRAFLMQTIEVFLFF